MTLNATCWVELFHSGEARQKLCWGCQSTNTIQSQLLYTVPFSRVWTCTPVPRVSQLCNGQTHTILVHISRVNTEEQGNSAVKFIQLSRAGQYKKCVQYDFKFTTVRNIVLPTLCSCELFVELTIVRNLEVANMYMVPRVQHLYLV